MYHVDLDLNRFNFKERLKKEVMSKFTSMNKFAKHTGMNATTLGLIFKNEQGLSPERLDLITEALGYEHGHFYEEYVDECYINGHIHYSKVIDFLYLCYMHGKIQVAEQIKKALWADTEKGKVIQTVLEVAEKLYLNGKVNDSEQYYDYIIKREEISSNRLAIAVMRKYSILRQQAHVEMTKVFLYKLIDMVNLLPLDANYMHNGKESSFNLQAEGYSLITRYFNSIEDWNSTYKFAKKLQSSSNGNEAYFAESLLYQFSSLRERGEIEEALKVNGEISLINAYYKRISKGNELLIRVEGGDQSCISSILEWIEVDDEMKLFLPIMMECFIRNNNLLEATETVEKYAHLFVEKFHPVKLLDQRRKSRLFLALADLYFELKEVPIACNYLVQAIEICLESQNFKRFQQCVLLMMKNLHNMTAIELQLVQDSMKGSDIDHVKT